MNHFRTLKQAFLILLVLVALMVFVLLGIPTILNRKSKLPAIVNVTSDHFEFDQKFENIVQNRITNQSSKSLDLKNDPLIFDLLHDISVTLNRKKHNPSIYKKTHELKKRYTSNVSEKIPLLHLLKILSNRTLNLGSDNENEFNFPVQDTYTVHLAARPARQVNHKDENGNEDNIEKPIVIDKSHINLERYPDLNVPHFMSFEPKIKTGLLKEKVRRQRSIQERIQNLSSNKPKVLAIRSIVHNRTTDNEHHIPSKAELIYLLFLLASSMTLCSTFVFLCYTVIRNVKKENPNEYGRISKMSDQSAFTNSCTCTL